jgi:hypothetical protein
MRRSTVLTIPPLVSIPWLKQGRLKGREVKLAALQLLCLGFYKMSHFKEDVSGTTVVAQGGNLYIDFPFYYSFLV